jgi:hypothetical protein
MKIIYKHMVLGPHINTFVKNLFNLLKIIESIKSVQIIFLKTKDESKNVEPM